jgi:hypothetical protein
VRRVATIEAASHPGWMFHRLAANRLQSKCQALALYKRKAVAMAKHKKNNDFRLITGRLSQKGNNYLKLFFAPPR